MRGKRRRSRVAGALTGLLGFACALMLGALFYGTMVYQLGGEEKAAASQAQIQPDAPRQDAQAADAFPGAVLALGEGKLTEERTAEETVEGVRCTVLRRVYTLEDGTQATAVSASPAAYMARLAEAGYVPQLVTGFAVAGLDAVCEARGQELALAARDGDCVYFIAAQASEQAMYALGASASLENR